MSPQTPCPVCGAAMGEVQFAMAGRWLACGQCASGPFALTAPGSPDAPPPAAEPERVTGKILGFRSWTLDGYRLHSRVDALGAHWVIGENKADCLLHRMYGVPDEARPWLPQHDAPDPDCHCGLYACHNPFWELGSFSPILVYGAVLAWGRVEVHRDGFRAQYAVPVVLAYPATATAEHRQRVQAVAGEMGVACVPLADLEAEGRKHGEPVAESLRPAPRESASEPALFGAWQAAVAPTATRRERHPVTTALAGLNLVLGAVNLATGITTGHLVNYAATTLSVAVALFIWLRGPAREVPA